MGVGGGRENNKNNIIIRENNKNNIIIRENNKNNIIIRKIIRIIL